jgi:hypothetical protein
VAERRWCAHDNRPQQLSSWAGSPLRSRGAALDAKSRAAMDGRIPASAVGEVGNSFEAHRGGEAHRRRALDGGGGACRY